MRAFAIEESEDRLIAVRVLLSDDRDLVLPPGTVTMDGKPVTFDGRPVLIHRDEAPLCRDCGRGIGRRRDATHGPELRYCDECRSRQSARDSAAFRLRRGGGIPPAVKWKDPPPDYLDLSAGYGYVVLQHCGFRRCLDRRRREAHNRWRQSHGLPPEFCGGSVSYHSTLEKARASTWYCPKHANLERNARSYERHRGRRAGRQREETAD